jgi:hypothetical protein
MAEATFYYHVTGDKDDLSSWVRDVISHLILTGQLQKANTQATAARRVEMRLNWLEARL